MRMRISIWNAHAHFILPCACVSHFAMRTRISSYYAHVHLILKCACAYYFGVRMRISFCYAHAHYIWGACQFANIAKTRLAHFFFECCILLKFEKFYSSERILEVADKFKQIFLPKQSNSLLFCNILVKFVSNGTVNDSYFQRPFTSCKKRVSTKFHCSKYNDQIHGPLVPCML